MQVPPIGSQPELLPKQYWPQLKPPPPEPAMMFFISALLNEFLSRFKLIFFVFIFLFFVSFKSESDVIREARARAEAEKAEADAKIRKTADQRANAKIEKIKQEIRNNANPYSCN